MEWRGKTDLLDCSGQFQAQLNDLVLCGGKVTDPSQRGSAKKKKGNKCQYKVLFRL